MSNCVVATAELGEALYKLLKISGAIETINMSMTGVFPYLTENFFIAMGESKTLKYVNMNTNARVNAKVVLLGKAIAMNAKKNGSLAGVSI